MSSFAGYAEDESMFAMSDHADMREAPGLEGWEVEVSPVTDDTASDRCEDTRFQKVIAWSSYYVLVFVSLCMFQPAAVAQAADVTGVTTILASTVLGISEILPGMELAVADGGASRWALRPGA